MWYRLLLEMLSFPCWRVLSLYKPFHIVNLRSREGLRVWSSRATRFHFCQHFFLSPTVLTEYRCISYLDHTDKFIKSLSQSGTRRNTKGTLSQFLSHCPSNWHRGCDPPREFCVILIQSGWVNSTKDAQVTQGFSPGAKQSYMIAPASSRAGSGSLHSKGKRNLRDHFLHFTQDRLRPRPLTLPEVLLLISGVMGTRSLCSDSCS